MYHRLINHFGRTRWYSLVMRPNLKLISVRLAMVLLLTQDRCIDCSESTIGLEIIIAILMELLGDVGHLESHFGPFGDSVHAGAR
jgi:hypothetical protein